MRIQYYYKNLNPKEKVNLRSLVEEKEGQITRMIYEAPETTLEVKGERTAKKKAYIVEFMFRHKGKLLVASEDDHTIQEAVDHALAGLTIQIRKVKHFLHNASPRWSQSRKLKDETRFAVFEDVVQVKNLSKKEFFRIVEDHLAKAKKFMLSEVRFLEGSGEIPEGELEADELVDEVILELWKDRNSFARKSSVFLPLFYRKALEVLNRQKKEVRQSRRVLSLESPVKSPQSTADDSEELEFWQPDDALTLADTLAVPPTTRSRLEELRRLVQEELEHVSAAQRQAFNLMYQSGFGLQDVSMIMRRPVKEVQKDIEYVIRWLRKKFAVSPSSPLYT